MESDLNKILKKHLDKIFVTLDQERMTVINAIMGNIDILIENSEKWFGEDNPDEFNRVVRSLFTVANFLVENQKDFDDILSVTEKKKINIESFFELIMKGLISILNYSEYKITSKLDDDSLNVFTSENVLKESVYNIFFSLYPFMKDNSHCEILIENDHFNVIVTLNFYNLTSGFPGPDIIKKRLFTYAANGEEKINIGVEPAMSSLRSIGSIVKVNDLNHEDEFTISIKFPRVELFKTLQQNKALSVDDKAKDEIICLSFDDPMMKLLIEDAVRDSGYFIKSLKISEILENIESCSNITGVILEYIDGMNDNDDFFQFLFDKGIKVIMIYGESINIDEFTFSKNTHNIQKPFYIENIIQILEDRI